MTDSRFGHQFPKPFCLYSAFTKSMYQCSSSDPQYHTRFREFCAVPRGTQGSVVCSPSRAFTVAARNLSSSLRNEGHKMFIYSSCPTQSARRLSENQSVLFHGLASHLLGVQLRRLGMSLVPWGGRVDLSAPSKPVSAPRGLLRPSQPSVRMSRVARAER